MAINSHPTVNACNTHGHDNTTKIIMPLNTYQQNTKSHANNKRREQSRNDNLAPSTVHYPFLQLCCKCHLTSIAIDTAKSKKQKPNHYATRSTIFLTLNKATTAMFFTGSFLQSI